MNMKNRMGVSVLALASILSLNGCGDKDEVKATQVAAKVNGEEITVHQINYRLAKLGNLGAEQTKLAAGQMLTSLVDQQLLVDKAIEEKMDRDPQVVQTLDENRRQVLANAYIGRMVQNVSKPTDTEIKDYYAKNPALFSERRIYKISELAVQVTPENAAAIKSKLESSKNLGEFVGWLKAQNIPARGGQSVKAAEQLPLELLSRLHGMKDGQIMTMNGNRQIIVLYLAETQSRPIGEEQAKTNIEAFLVNSRKREIAAAELKKLHATAKIEYMGEYAEANKKAAPSAPAAEGGSAQKAAVGQADAKVATGMGDQAIK
jgi:EpsD family peptidyl-prolyl cis-trans isomerase